MITKILKSTSPATSWSGGTTTQLAIWPPYSSYTNRTFEWRISTASVEVPESDFTPLPGYSRILMVLEGSLQMTHNTPEGSKQVALNELEQASFEGSWLTTGRGQVVDFNVMTSNDWQAELILQKGDGAFEIDVAEHCFVWILQGMVEIAGFVLHPDEGLSFSGPQVLTGQKQDSVTLLIVRLQKR